MGDHQKRGTVIFGGGGESGNDYLDLTHLIWRGDQHMYHERVDSMSGASAVLHHSQLLKNTHTRTRVENK